MAGTLEIPVVGSANSIADPRVKSSLETLNGKLNSENKLEGANIVSESVTNTQLAAAAKPFDWYTPKFIATEETRESASFGTLTTADEIKEVVLPTNGLIAIGFMGLIKSSVSAAGRVAIFIGANQLKFNGTTVPEVNEATTTATSTTLFSSYGAGLINAGAGTSFVTTGQAIGATGAGSQLCWVFAAAGTYNISVQFKATSGSITAKERKLWVSVLGV